MGSTPRLSQIQMAPFFYLRYVVTSKKTQEIGEKFDFSAVADQKTENDQLMTSFNLFSGLITF